MEIAGVILLAVVIAVAILKMRAGQKNNEPRAKKRSGHKISAAGKRKIATAHDFHSVSIKSGPSACQSVKDLTDKRFLPDEAPSVPLINCNSAHCTCKFVHHEIRREQEEDRRAPSALRTTLYDTSGNPDRRHGGRRRSTDLK